MKPTNYKKEGCDEFKSSNCVIWDGPDIDCIKLCKGDSISDVTYKLAVELCKIMDMLKVSNYDLSCLDIQACAPTTFQELIQLIITKLCEALAASTGGTASRSSISSNSTVTIAQCFQYPNPANGDMVTTLAISDYAQLIGIKVCALVSTYTTVKKQIENHESRIVVLEKKPAPTFTLPSIVPTCVLTPTPTSIDLVLAEVEKQFCQLLGATGDVTAIYNSIARQPVNLDSAKSLGTHGGTMSSIDGWVTTVKNLADSVNNIWLVLDDLRSAVTNIKLNCCSTVCDGVAVSMSAALPSSSTLLLYFSGSMPAGVVECDAVNGTLFTITDQSGNSITTHIKLIANLNIVSGYPITLTGTPIVASDDLTITATICVKDSETDSVCQSCLEYVFINTLSCPSVLYNSGISSIDYTFSHVSGAMTYVIQLFNNAGTTMIASQTHTVTNPTTIEGTFGSLDASTNYKVRVIMISATRTTTCPFSPVSTLQDPCPAPESVQIVFSIP